MLRAIHRAQKLMGEGFLDQRFMVIAIAWCIRLFDR
jgi:hypothetical protein